jgi:nucleotide-binding universal stress UspA family protein
LERKGGEPLLSNLIFPRRVINLLIGAAMILLRDRKQTITEKSTVGAIHVRTGWQRLIFGSVAEKVISLAPRSVLTIRAPREEDLVKV